jgi:tetratricopeptide (TPR) repeat protein
MTPEQWQEVRRHFEVAVDTHPDQRNTYLARIESPSTRSEVARLLGEMSEAGSFLEQPAVNREWLLAPHFGPSLEPGKVLLDRFEVLELLGAGGMGEVYAAHDRRLGEKVAIKTILPALGVRERYVELFRSEVSRARQITHPNVCRIYDLFEDQALVFFTMELVVGISLARRLRDSGPYGPAEALPLVEQIANGLDAAHRTGLIHRDLKPGNVLMGEDGRAVITDFGLARPNTAEAFGDPAGGAQSSGGKAAGGTLRYFAPEQLNGDPASRATDIYAFGLVVYQLITGGFPFEATDPFLEVTKRLTSRPVAPSKRVAHLPEVWDRAILQCLAANPEQRPRSAGEVVAILRGEEGPRLSLPRVDRRLALILGGTAAAVAAGLLLNRGPSSSPPGQRTKPWMVLADPTGPGGHPELTAALRQAMLTGFDTAETLQVYPSWRVKAALALMGMAADQPLDEERGVAIAKREGLPYVGLGEVRLSGDAVVLSFRVVGAASGETIASASETSSNDAGLAGAADRLARAIRRQVGDVEAAVEASPPLARVTTTSFAALARFSDGLRYYEEGKSDQALTLLKSATEIDPEFAMAFEYQALVYSALGEERLGFPLAERAYLLRDRATERERMQIAAMFEIFKGNYEKGLEGYRALAAVYPDDPRIQRQLAHHYSMAGRTHEAALAASQAAALDTRPLTQAAQALVLAQSGDVQRARQVTGLALRRGVDARLLGWADGLADLVEGDATRAEASFRRFGELVGHHSNAVLYVAGALTLGGKLTEALEELEASLAAILVRQEFLFEIRHRHQAGLLANRTGRAAQTRAHAVALSDLPAQPWNLDALRFGAHLAFEVDDLRRLELCADKLATIDRAYPGTRSEGFSREARGLASLLKKQPEDARSFARQAAALWPDCWSQWWLGRVLAATGGHRAAIEPLRKLVQQAGSAFRFNGTVPWVEAHLLLARCWRQLGDRAAAETYYDRYLKVWQSAASYNKDTQLAVAERAALRQQ